MRNYRVCDSIEAYAFEKALDKACEELEEVDKMSDAEACVFCNTDTKEEALEVIQEEIDYHYCPVKILDLEINRVDHHPLGR